MKRLLLPATAVLALALAACQSSGFGSGTSVPGGMEPPVNGNQPMGGTVGGVGYPGQPTPFGTPTPSPPPGNSVSYPFAQSQTGWLCPEVGGFTCVLRFNLPAPPPSPSPHATATPSPTPSPQPTAPTPTPSPTPPGGFVNIALAAMPKDAPAMINPDPKALATNALMTLQLHTDADQVLQGYAILEFMLPKSEIPDRGFALQLFHQMNVKGKTVNTFVASYSKSTVKDSTLRFEFTTPPIPVKKNETWLLVLYGDDLPKKSPSPSPSPSATPAASASPSSSPSQ